MPKVASRRDEYIEIIDRRLRDHDVVALLDWMRTPSEKRESYSTALVAGPARLLGAEIEHALSRAESSELSRHEPRPKPWSVTRCRQCAGEMVQFGLPAEARVENLRAVIERLILHIEDLAKVDRLMGSAATSYMLTARDLAVEALEADMHESISTPAP